MAEEKRKNVSTDVAEKISHMILVAKRFAPGDKLPNERDFAEELGVSRTSIREAFKLLHANGMLEIRRNVGAFVNENPGMVRDPFGLSQPGDPGQLCLDWYELRLALEPQAMPWVVSRASDHQLDALEELGQSVSLRVGGGENYWELDLRFHEELAKASGNTLLARMFSGIGQPVSRVLIGAQPDGRADPVLLAMRSHEDILKFLRMRDADGAALAMRYHLLQGLRHLKNVL